MSQTDTTNTVTYDGTSTDGGTTGVFAFAFSYPISVAGDLEVTVITESTGAESIKAITTNYTVSIASDLSSATVTFVAGEAPLSTEAVVLNRRTALTQASTYGQHNNIENDLDKGTQADLSLQEQIDRCVQLPLADTVAHDGNSDTVTSPVLPTVIGATAGDVLTLASGKTSLEYTTANASNATHTGEVTGSAALTVDPTAISNKTLVTGVSGDMLLIEDATDGALKRVDANDFLGGSNATHTGEVTGATVLTVGPTTISNKTLVTGVAGDMILIEDATDGALKRIDAGDLITTANATHTGQVTGSGALTVDVTAISDQTLVTGVAGDMVLIEDATDGALKRVDLTDLIDVAGNLTGHITSTGLATTLGSFTAAQLNTAVSDDTLMLDLVDDTTPQLGAELDCNGFSLGHTLQSGTGDGTTTIDWGTGNIYKHQFGAFNETFTFTAPTKPGTFILVLVQDSVGSRTVTWPGTVDWPSGTAPTLTTTATTGTDIIHFVYDGTNYYGTSAGDFS